MAVDAIPPLRLFIFASKNNLPFFFVSAADGTNVVKVFHAAVEEARRSANNLHTLSSNDSIHMSRYKAGGGDIMSEVLDILKGGQNRSNTSQAKESRDTKDSKS
jgi:hypothetical protein